MFFDHPLGEVFDLVIILIPKSLQSIIAYILAWNANTVMFLFLKYSIVKRTKQIKYFTYFFLFKKKLLFRDTILIFLLIEEMWVLLEVIIVILIFFFIK